MSRKSDDWMPLYIGHYMRDTAHLSTTQHGAYLLLIMACWTRGGRLKFDHSQLASIVKMRPEHWRKIWPVLEQFFELEGSEIIQRRVAKEAEKSKEISDKRRRAGAMGGSKRVANASAKSNTRVYDHTTPSELHRPKKEAPTSPPKKAAAEAATDMFGPVPEKPGRTFRLPDDWEPRGRDREFALSEGLTPEEIDRAALEFKNHWSGVGGSAGKKLEWSGTWRNRVLLVADRKRERAARLADRSFANGGGQGPTSFVDVIAKDRFGT